ncbi:MAG: DUF61 family protein [Euryarchaeota archaeon]|nr:DUF61 family protein [Euryarchaeota archaeon]
MYPDPPDGRCVFDDLNADLPVNRRTLSDYLENGDCTYTTRSGATGTFDPRELEVLRSVCTDAEAARLRIPLLICTDCTSENGAWRVDGKVESAVVSKILGKDPRQEDRILMHYPDFKRVRTLLPELATVVFSP